MLSTLCHNPAGHQLHLKQFCTRAASRFRLLSPVRAASTSAAATPSNGTAHNSKDAHLAAAWHKQSRLLTSSGTLSLSQQDPLHLFYTTNKEGGELTHGMLSFPLAGPEAAKAVQQLVDAAEPSPFGKGKQTVLDPAVRTASEIKAPRLALNKQLPPPEVLEEVRALLQPNASSLVADLDKLNIYEAGGHFKPHYDTPRSADHIGTLIISLPTPFKGGQLVLRHVDPNSKAAQGTALSKTYDFAAMQGSSLQDLQWAAFYTDTEHEVLPVTEGHRLTLTYNLRAIQKHLWPAPLVGSKLEVPGGAEKETNNTTGSKQKEEEAAVADSSWITPADASASAELTAELQRLLADKAWHPDGEQLGFVLQHKHCADMRDLAAMTFPQALKGPDRVLAAALTQAGLRFRVVPLFRGWTGDAYERDWEEEEEEGWEPAEPNFGRPLQPAQLVEPLNDVTKGAYWALMTAKFNVCKEVLSEGYVEDAFPCLDGDTTLALTEVFGAQEADVCWVTPVLDEHFTYHSSVLAGANTAYEVHFPATAAILVDVPSWKDRAV